MIPIDFEVKGQGHMLTYRPNPVRMITRHRIDTALSNLAQTCVLECR